VLADGSILAVSSGHGFGTELAAKAARCALAMRARSVLATWRYLSYDMKSDARIQSAYLNGPTIGVAFRW